MSPFAVDVERRLGVFGSFSFGRGYGPDIKVGKEVFSQSVEMQRMHLAHEIAHALQARKTVRRLGDAAGRRQFERVSGSLLNFDNSAFAIRYNPLYALRGVQAETLAQRVIGSHFGLSPAARKVSNAYINGYKGDLAEILAGLWD